ncbi:hypothetical protein HHI36_019276 [Cryptolaemus montrouzieri]|uniref:Reverse transcriptase n=1 Tax=Cryptolaemus montrouzieri TaxID=559131 RepID=A0ABD2P3H2_9CUCU
MNKTLDIVQDWLKMNKLKLNAAKTMLFGSKSKCAEFRSKNYKIIMDDQLIDFVQEMKYLGIVFDQQLNSSKHADFLCKKIGKEVGYLGRISRKLSPWCRRVVYNTIIAPHLNYCISLQISSTGEDIPKLQIVQNRGSLLSEIC